MTALPYTLSRVNLSVKITSGGTTILAGGVPSGASPSNPTPVLVTEVTVSYRVNDLSEASVALGYSSRQGYQKLLKLFPREGSEGAYFAQIEINLLPGGPRSYEALKTPGSKPFFKGLIVGFNHRKSGSDISFVVNAFSSSYPLTQIPVSSPGYHPTSGMSLGTVSMIGNATFAGGGDVQTITANSLVGPAQGEVNPVKVVKGIITEVLKAWDQDPAGAGVSTSLRAALQAYGLAETKTRVAGLVAGLTSVGSLGNVILRDTAGSAILGITRTMLRSNAMTFWAFILAIFDQYGVDLICMGDSCFGYALNPLGDVPPTNVIEASEEAVVAISDFPFDSPTRCVVIGPGLQTLSTEVGGKEYGEFPKGEKLTSQEEKTGVKTVVVQAPAFLADTVAASMNQAYRDHQTLSKLQGGFAPANLVILLNALKKREEESARTADQLAYDAYAQFTLMKLKFRQRTGMCVLRLRPNILPGFCVKIEDPLTLGGKSVATVFAYVTEVTHTISHQNESAQTSMALSYVRYDGEVPDALRVNPLYPNADPKADAAQILSEGLGL